MAWEKRDSVAGSTVIIATPAKLPSAALMRRVR
jgi:hypothetical protein